MACDVSARFVGFRALTVPMVMTSGSVIQPMAAAVSARPGCTVAPTATTTGFALRAHAAVSTASSASECSCVGYRSVRS